MAPRRARRISEQTYTKTSPAGLSPLLRLRDLPLWPQLGSHAATCSAPKQLFPRTSGKNLPSCLQIRSSWQWQAKCFLHSRLCLQGGPCPYSLGPAVVKEATACTIPPLLCTPHPHPSRRQFSQGRESPLPCMAVCMPDSESPILPRPSHNLPSTHLPETLQLATRDWPH